MKVLTVATLLTLTAILAQDASAYLPSSEYGVETGWEGYRQYTEDDFDLWVVWTVYDIMNYDVPDFLADIDFEDDQYVYAYQLFNNDGLDIGGFSVLDSLGDPLLDSLAHLTQSIEDPEITSPAGGVSPYSSTVANWVWNPGLGFVSTDQASAFLIFSSPYEPVAGTFEIRGSEDSDDFPSTDTGSGETETPEPATIALFAFGAAWLATKKNK